MAAAGPVISFVVPAYNEERLVGRTVGVIAGAARELGLHHEIIVVDDASSDRTAAEARAAGARVIEVSRRQIAATRNAGARAAAGDRIIFVDADTLVDARVVAAAIEALDRGAVGGGATVLFDGRVPLWARLSLLALNATLRLTRVAAGCFLFVRRDAFEAVGGFDERMYAAEEIALSQALKKRGRLVILRDRVVTSGRKVRAHSYWELTVRVVRLALRGPRATRDRGSFDIWYEARREDPGPP